MIHPDRVKEELSTLRLYLALFFAATGSLTGWVAAKIDSLRSVLVILAVIIAALLSIMWFAIGIRMHRLLSRLERQIWSGP